MQRNILTSQQIFSLHVQNCDLLDNKKGDLWKCDKKWNKRPNGWKIWKKDEFLASYIEQIIISKETKTWSYWE